jgi:hypothetical protein
MNSSNHQMRDAINTLIAAQAGVTSIMSETVAAQSLKQAFSLGARMPRGAAMKRNALGSVGGLLVVGCVRYASGSHAIPADPLIA